MIKSSPDFELSTDFKWYLPLGAKRLPTEQSQGLDGDLNEGEQVSHQGKLRRLQPIWNPKDGDMCNAIRLKKPRPSWHAFLVVLFVE